MTSYVEFVLGIKGPEEEKKIESKPLAAKTTPSSDQKSKPEKKKEPEPKKEIIPSERNPPPAKKEVFEKAKKKEEKKTDDAKKKNVEVVKRSAVESKPAPKTEVKRKTPKKSSSGFTDFHKFTCTTCDMNTTGDRFPVVQNLGKVDTVFDRQNLESALFERMSLLLEDTCLDYLMKSLKRVDIQIPVYQKKKKRIEAKDGGSGRKREAIKKAEARVSDLQFIRTSILRTIGVLFFDLQLFPQKNGDMRRRGIAHEFLGKLVSGNSDEKLLHGILNSLIKLYSNEPEMLKQVFNPLLLLTRERMTQADYLVENTYRGYLDFLDWVTCHPILREMIVDLPTFLTHHNVPTGRQMEFESYFGPFLRLTAMASDPKVGKVLFRGKLLVVELHSIHRNWRLRNKQNNELLGRVFQRFLKKDDEMRQKMIAWISAVLRGNEDKAKLMSQSRTTSSDGFLNNLNFIMLFLSRPFTEPKKNLHKKVDPLYSMSKALHLQDSTKMCLKVSESANEFKKLLAERPGSFTEEDLQNSNLVTQMYFLSMKATHLGLLSSLRRQRHLQDQIRRVRSQRDLYASIGLQGSAQHKKAQADYDAITIKIWSNETHIYCPRYHESCSKLYIFNQHVILNLMKSPVNEIELDNNIPMPYRLLPEFFLVDVIDHFTNLKDAVRFRKIDLSKVLFHIPFNSLIDLMILILGNKSYYNNINERSKFTEILINFAPLGDQSKSIDPEEIVMRNSLFNNTKARRYLMEVLSCIYIDVERMENSYYLKYKPRMEVSVLMKRLWDYKVFKSSFERRVAKNSDLFIRLFNLHISDCTKLLDDCIDRLKSIHEYEVLKKSPIMMSTKTKEELDDLENKNKGDRDYVKKMMAVAELTVDMLKFISADMALYFNKPGLIERIANMLNHFLYNLIETPQNLAVSNRDELNFKPKELLKEITDIYLHLSPMVEFIRAVASDSRSFRREMFKKCGRVLKAKQLKSNRHIERFEDFSARVLEDYDMRKNVNTISVDNWMEWAGSEEDDTPEEFECAISNEIMTDPVKLPNGTVVDRPNILRALMDNPTNPFTKKHLTEDMLVELPDLKKQIDEYLEKKRNER